MNIIKLVKSNLCVKIDDEDFDYLSQFKWYLETRGNRNYARRFYLDRFNKKIKGIYLHRDLLKPVNKNFIDHIDGDGLNNQKSNLRECTQLENNRNISKQQNCLSKFKGVTQYFRNKNKWKGYITTNGKQISLGIFNTEIEAAKAYDKKAKELFGEFAKLNFNDK